MNFPTFPDASQRAAGRVWRFSGCEFDESRHELRVAGQPVNLEVKPVEVLYQLLLHAGEVVTKEELMAAVWPGITVLEGSLTNAVSKLRKALADGDGIVVTVPRIGYRLDGPVESRAPAPHLRTALELKPGEPVPGREQWRLLRQLDRTLSSEVWLAENPKTRETRVFKFVPDGPHLNELKREVTLSRLLRETYGNRPDFVRILEWNFETQPYFLESEYAGPTLAEWAASQGGLSAIPLRDRLRLMADIAEGVAAAHSCGVLHKDLKPGNILVTRDTHGEWRIRIADFGSASLLDPALLASLGITNLGFTQPAGAGSPLSGTLMYVAPELLSGQSPSTAADIYALGVLLYQMAAGDFRMPLAPGWETNIDDPLLRRDIAEAACGDPERRLATAAELALRLRARAHSSQAAPGGLPGSSRTRAVVAATAALLLLALLMTGLALRPSASVSAPLKTVAVLPFLDIGTVADSGYLSLALADEVATTLSHIRGIAVRPPAGANANGHLTTDLQKAGRDLHAAVVVTGHYAHEQNELVVTLEAVDVAADRVLWQDRIDAPAESRIATDAQITLRVRRGLVPALGLSANVPSAQPSNEEAFDLYLRSLSLTLDVGNNSQAVGMLERATRLDPGYAPAWIALGRRYYVSARFAGAGQEEMRRYEAAMDRAASLDPDYVPAIAGLIVSRVERGDLVAAYEKAAALVRKRPDSADAQFALSYSLRFAGLLPEAGQHCETALLLDQDAQTSGLRSCALVFLLQGDFPRALNYLQLDPDSEMAKAFGIEIALREGNIPKVLSIGAPRIPDWTTYQVLLGCIGQKPGFDAAALAAQIRPHDDPESNYLAAGHLAWCGLTAPASDLLKRAIAGGYCSYPAIDRDPVFASLRRSPQFDEIRRSALACRQRFLSARSAGSNSAR